MTSVEFAELYDWVISVWTYTIWNCIRSLSVDEHLLQFNSICYEILDAIAPLTVKHIDTSLFPGDAKNFTASALQSLVIFQKASKDANFFFHNANNPKTLFATVNAVINPIQNMHPDPAVSVKIANLRCQIPFTGSYFYSPDNTTVWSDFQLTSFLPALKDIAANIWMMSCHLFLNEFLIIWVLIFLI